MYDYTSLVELDMECLMDARKSLGFEKTNGNDFCSGIGLWNNRHGQEGEFAGRTKWDYFCEYISVLYLVTIVVTQTVLNQQGLA
jgi:hypothetical protein